LELTGELHPASWLPIGLDYALQPCPVRLNGSPGNRINYWVDFIALTHCVERGKCEACFCPQRGHDEFLAARLLDRFYEFFVFPGINRRAVKWLDPGQYFLQLLDCRFVDAILPKYKSLKAGRWQCWEHKYRGVPTL
jgi:hypothetical protein